MADNREINFAQLTPDDLEELIRISRETFTQSFFHLNNPEDFEAYTSRAFNAKTLKEELESERAVFYFVYCDSVLAGYFKINLNTGPEHQPDLSTMELQRIYVLAAFQSSGLGSRIMDFIIRLAKSGKGQSIWLGVWEHNLAAIRFYEKHGFVKFGEHSFMMGQDRQTDYLYRLQWM